MKKLVIAFFSVVAFMAIIGTLLLVASNEIEAEPASKVYVSKTYDVKDFNEIELELPASIKYETGTPYCHIECSDNIADDLKIVVSGKTLRIYTDKKIKNIKKLEITLNSSSLESVILNGAADFECKKGFDAKHFSLQGNGAIDVEIENLVSETVKVGINGAGDVELKDLSSSDTDVQVNGAGTVVLSGSSEEVKVVINGAGKADVSSLRYGNISAQTNGVGSIVK